MSKIDHKENMSSIGCYSIFNYYTLFHIDTCVFRKGNKYVKTYLIDEI